ncbi:MAG: SIMPL domain-containing protein [Balneolaceae bacterium]
MESTGKIIQRLSFIGILLFFGMNSKAIAQQPQNRAITINISASEILPADLVIFNINVNAEAESPQEAFETHKEREAILADLLKEFDIKEEDIDHQPIRMSKRYRNENDSQTTVTNQSVSVTFSDFSIYEKIQVALIEDNFDSFNGQFSSSELAAGKDKALEKAIETAKEKADFIAETSGVKLGVISNINYSDHEIGFPVKMMESSDYGRSSSSMMDFGQTVSVTANINISFEIE